MEFAGASSGGRAAEIMSESLRSHLRQITRIHHVMFEKFLSDGAPPTELAGLLEDAGVTYLRMAESISEQGSPTRP
jgi:hypothetical protein